MEFYFNISKDVGVRDFALLGVVATVGRANQLYFNCLSKGMTITDYLIASNPIKLYGSLGNDNFSPMC